MTRIDFALTLRVILSGIALAAGVSAASAAPVAPLTTFTAGKAAKASEVNGNFTTIVNTVNANDARLTTVETNKQNLVSGSCPQGSAIRAIAANGITVTCQSTGGNVGFASVNSVSAVPIDSTTTTSICIIFCSPIGRFQTSSGGGFLFAPISLPHGATITALSFSCLCNNSAGSSAILFREDSAVASVNITTISATVQNLSTTTITAGTELVDNQNHAYLILWTTNGTAGSSIIPVNAIVTYTLP